MVISISVISGAFADQVGAELKSKAERHTVVIRSTILPGTMHKIALPVLGGFSGKKARVDFGACHNPEFLREARR
jgi:GDP-mannose 6-dehydrogenase